MKKDNRKNIIINNKAFSLIELSIVLIIIGLLVAGVTGGKSLIESAKIRGYMNEINYYRQAVNAFYAAQGRLPGDLNRDGIIGHVRIMDNAPAIETYTASSFPAPYNTKAPNAKSAPFIDLYLEGLIDFKPSETNPTGESKIGYPLSKIYSKNYFVFGLLLYFINLTNRSYYNTGDTKIYLFSTATSPEVFPAELAKKIDVKFDDGKYNEGQIRANCDGDYVVWGSNTYDSAINRTDENKRNCNAMMFFMF